MSKISWETLSVTSRRGAPTSRRQNYISLPCRDVDLHVATSFLTPLCHVATWMYTSRRQLVTVSVTSRRGPARRDVNWSCALSRHDVTPTSRCDPVFSPRMVHFGPSPYTPPLIETLAPLRPRLHQTCRSSHPTGRRPSTAHRPPVFLFESSSSAGFGS